MRVQVSAMSPDELIQLVENAERAERVKRGLPRNHILDWAEYPFAFARAELDEYCRVVLSSQAHFFHATAHALRMDFEAANAAMERFQAKHPHDPNATIRFGATPTGSIMNLPDVTGSYPSESAFFLCCDGIYFRKFGIVLLRSIAETSPGLRVHIHLMNPDPSLMQFVDPLKLTISLTTEVCPQNREYYHAIRLIRFSEALKSCAGSLVMTDTDALATRAVELEGPLSLRVRAGRILPWNQFSACYIRGDANSRPYFERVAGIIKSAPLWWGVDQHALYSAWIALKPHIQLAGPETASVDDTPGSFWFTAGPAKARLLSDTTQYAKLFQHYIAHN